MACTVLRARMVLRVLSAVSGTAVGSMAQRTCYGVWSYAPATECPVLRSGMLLGGAREADRREESCLLYTSPSPRDRG
eukprot:2000607-Rhodomonas_salina.1